MPDKFLTRNLFRITGDGIIMKGPVEFLSILSHFLCTCTNCYLRNHRGEAAVVKLNWNKLMIKKLLIGERVI